ncbi:GntR family transcriptional regulator [Sinirhodobacter populi]|uniref:GntR family transcriptional regulator n=1 Tax=Paenirhodobacter populi TaxID=2306993 RepID=A0A443K6L1_9RHOB|nr:GntR family transcriptional regulator [Sinirhodobacter populi]RWR28382.1 GntR family transcriptional regulator [Sinirhodobacter populi]
MHFPLPEALEPEKTENQVETAYQQIEDLIVSMELEPGARVSEVSLMTRLGIGRTPIREALLRLAADQLLISQPRRGMVVRDTDFPMQMKVLETRKALEGVLVPAAARRRNREEAAIMAGVVSGFRDLIGRGENLQLLRLDRRFVSLLVDFARNPFLAQILPLYSLSRRFWLAHRELYLRRFRDETLTEFHILIGEAVAAGDERLAHDRVTEFLAYVEEYTIFLGTELSEPVRR